MIARSSAADNEDNFTPERRARVMSGSLARTVSHAVLAQDRGVVLRVPASE